MKYNINIRQEVFGGTLFNLENGKRSYINMEELRMILNEGKLPNDLILENTDKKNNIKFTALNVKDINHFSFADIAFIKLLDYAI